MDNNKNIMLHSYLLCRGYESEEFTIEDIINMSNYEVSNCLITLYLKVVRMLAEGKSYEEIIEFVDNYKEEDYELLDDDKKTYIKSKTKKDLIKRKMSLEKETI